MDARSIEAALLTDYGLAARFDGNVEGGMDPSVRSLKFLGQEDSGWFVKVRHTAPPKRCLARALADTGVGGIATPIRTLAGSEFCKLGDAFVQVFSWIEGRNGFERALEPTQWRRLGELLRQVHAAELCSKVREEILTEDFRRSEVDEIRELAIVLEFASEHLALAVFALLKTHQFELSALLEEIVRLGSMAASAAWQLSPCHADIHLGNVICDDMGGVTIVDWDSPRMAPIECDLMFFQYGGILGRHGEAEEAAFFEGYGEVHPNVELVAFYRLARRVEDIATFAKESCDPSRSQVEREESLLWLAKQFHGD